MMFSTMVVHSDNFLQVLMNSFRGTFQVKRLFKRLCPLYGWRAELAISLTKLILIKNQRIVKMTE